MGELRHGHWHSRLNKHAGTLGMPGVIGHVHIFIGLDQTLLFRLIHQVGGH
ncbi:hypothetical protein DLNHIDIE_03582 [Acidithiobacillus thiooxidans ATCC 19377]|uniref:Uncharacterized protein n=1 Tax=Acidithiobacillus thiooxidans ATCC 19377 TaxID=637390 RepID=A0A543PYE4_ACITH|nr:hypothetical protein DLNHIDIE_03582 [Acidithiobacillus thiooxidans ATCC 19377]